jgi:hypothetical protein
VFTVPFLLWGWVGFAQVAKLFAGTPKLAPEGPGNGELMG